MSDSDISNDGIGIGDQDLINEPIQNAASEMMTQKVKILRHAINEGYDGVDFIQNPNQQLDLAFDFHISEDVEAWRSEPPAHDREMVNVQRYDFRYYDRETLKRIANRGAEDPHL